MFTSFLTRAVQRTLAVAKPMVMPKPFVAFKPFPQHQQQQPQLFNNIARDFHIKLKKSKDKPKQYKFRPHHASVKRYWQTGSGMLMRWKQGMNHKRRRKTKAQLRRLGKKVEVPKIHYRRISKMLGIRPNPQLPPGQRARVAPFWQPPVNALAVNKKRYA